MSAFSLAGHFSSFRSMADGSVRLTFDTREATPSMMANITAASRKDCYLAVSADNFTSDMLREMENVKVEYDDPKKSQSYRIRAILFILWTQNSEGYNIFNDYYIAKTEGMIEKLKGLIID